MANKVTITISAFDAGVLDLILKNAAKKISDQDFLDILTKQYGYCKVDKQYVAETLLNAIKV